MQEPLSYKEVFALAEKLPPEQLARLIGELSKFLHERYGRWTDLKDVEEVREYIEWYASGTPIMPQVDGRALKNSCLSCKQCLPMDYPKQGYHARS